jgi:hypothetical protein
VRNWVVAGSPLYPASLTFAGVTIGRGAFGREVMNNSGWQHLEGIGYVWTVLQRAFGADLLIMWLAFGAVGTATLALQRRWWPLTLGLLTPAAILGLFWFGIPYNNELSARYIFPAVALAMLMIPAAFRAKPLPGAVVHAALLGTILWLVIISSDALVGQHHIWLYVVLTIAAATSWRFFRRRAALSVLLLGVTCAATFVYSMTRCPGAGCDLIQMSAFNRPTMFEGWDWMEQHAAGAVIAYSGTNIPYRLLGPHFQNRVSYINIDRHFDWLYHDYARAERRNADYKPPDAPNPPYARQRGFREAWIQNLRRAEVDYFFVTRLSPLEIDNFRHNDAGFPEEDEWARADPQMFQLVFENPEVRIYAVHR